jgi:hypothetical protein
MVDWGHKVGHTSPTCVGYTHSLTCYVGLYIISNQYVLPQVCGGGTAGGSIPPSVGKLQERQNTKYLNRFLLVSNQKLNQRLSSSHITLQ